LFSKRTEATRSVVNFNNTGVVIQDRRIVPRVARWYVFKPNTHFWSILEGLALEDAGAFYGPLVYFTYGHLVYFVAIWYILLPFGIFFPFWYVVPRQIWQP
jgi:hypothetical protein